MIFESTSTTPIDEVSDPRICPKCGMKTIHGMPGGRDATCTNCGYKDPCCYD